jgi:hypothetical protein
MRSARQFSREHNAPLNLPEAPFCREKRQMELSDWIAAVM